MPSKREILEKLLEEVLKLQRKLAEVEEKVDGLRRSIPIPFVPQPYVPVDPQPATWPAKNPMPIVVMYGCSIDYKPDGTLVVPEYKLTTTSGEMVVLSVADSSDTPKTEKK